MITQLHRISDEALADEIGALDQEAKRVERSLKAMKAEFKARGVEEARGSRFAVLAKTSVRISLDTTRIKKVMGDAWADEFSRMSEVTNLRVAAA